MAENIGRGARAARPLEPMEPMRIEVIGEDESSSAQARTYAESKIFAALAKTRSMYAAHASSCDETSATRRATA